MRVHQRLGVEGPPGVQLAGERLLLQPHERRPRAVVPRGKLRRPKVGLLRAARVAGVVDGGGRGRRRPDASRSDLRLHHHRSVHRVLDPPPEADAQHRGGQLGVPVGAGDPQRLRVRARRTLPGGNRLVLRCRSRRKRTVVLHQARLLLAVTTGARGQEVGQVHPDVWHDESGSVWVVHRPAAMSCARRASFQGCAIAVV
mmetsp:Transcript_74564/g.216314  ORF Transcript_74564/g.216314 Transcript_74564/m.216314 type:complete len:200 (-) Transcript_74564:31-630(-)